MGYNSNFHQRHERYLDVVERQMVRESKRVNRLITLSIALAFLTIFAFLVLVLR